MKKFLSLLCLLYTSHELDVGIQAVAAGQVLDLGEQIRRRGLAVDAVLLRVLHGLGNGLDVYKRQALY